MEGLGYAGERGERDKVKAVAEKPVEAEKPNDAEAGKPAETTEEKPAEAAEPAAPEVEVFYTFRWVPPKRPNAGRDQKPRGQKPRKGGKPKPQSRNKTHSARVPSKDKPFDPDNPFAALAALKAKD